MDPAIKKVAILLACALIVVIGLIVLVSGTDAKKAEVATVNETKVEAQIAQTEENKAPTAHEPNEESKASLENVTIEAQQTEDAQGNEMYEGALAGLSEDEIGRLKDAIEGQNSDGLGEGLEQKEIYIDEGDLYVSYWHSGDDYFLYDDAEMEDYLSHGKGMSMGG